MLHMNALQYAAIGPHNNNHIRNYNIYYSLIQIGYLFFENGNGF